MNERRVALVTGASGFIGSHLVDHLLGEGWDEIRGLDDFSAGEPVNLRDALRDPRFHLVEGSTHDESLLAGMAANATHVFHLAAKLGPMYVEKYPDETVLDTVAAIQNVLGTVRPLGIPLFVASTSEIYGDSARQPLSEDDDIIVAPPANPRASYGLAKGIAELFVNTYVRAGEGPAVIGRLFNTIGPRQSGAYGHVVPSFVSRAIAGEPIVIHGTGDQTRSFTSVADAVRAIVATLLSPAAVGETVNLGSQHETTITELARLVLQVTGSPSELRYEPYENAHGAAARDIRRRVPDVTKLHRLTGYACTTPVETSIRAIVDCHRDGADVAS